MSSSRVRIDISRKYPISKIARAASHLIPDSVLSSSAQNSAVVDITEVISAPLHSHSVFFKSLNKRTTAEHIVESFAPFGTLLLVRLPFNVNKKCNVGYGFVVFEDAEVARSLLISVKKLRINKKLIDLLPFSKKVFADQREIQPRICDGESSADAANSNSKCNRLESRAPPIAQTKSLFTENSDDFVYRVAKRLSGELAHEEKPTRSSYHMKQTTAGSHLIPRHLDHSVHNIRFRLRRLQKNNSRLSGYLHRTAQPSRLQVL